MKLQPIDKDKIINNTINLIQDLLLELESFNKDNITEKHKLKHVLLEHYLIQIESIEIDTKTKNELNEYLRLLNNEIIRVDLKIIKSIYN